MSPYFQNEEQKYRESESSDQKDIKAEEWNCFDHIIWFNVFWFTGLHIAAVYGAYLCFTDAKLLTILFGWFEI